ncbi:MAG: hypothetical protein MJ175_05055 [Clostridia bacterium]|nr:hypothetical protein [Clostridia bacterium]
MNHSDNQQTELHYSDNPRFNQKVFAYIKSSIPALKMRDDASGKAGFFREEIKENEKVLSAGRIGVYLVSAIRYGIALFLIWLLFVNLMTTFVWHTRYDDSTGLTAVFTGNAGYTSAGVIAVISAVIGYFIGVLSYIPKMNEAKKKIETCRKNMATAEKLVSKSDALYEQLCKLVPADLIHAETLSRLVNLYECGYFDTVEDGVDYIRMEGEQQSIIIEHELARAEAEQEDELRRQCAEERRSGGYSEPLTEDEEAWLDFDYNRRIQDVEDNAEQEYEEMKERYDPYYDR